MSLAPTQTPQAAGQRTFLRGRYAATKLYQATDNFVPTNQFEIGVSTGDLLGIIQQKDPMGDRSRWFCDNGVSQGFVPASLLAPLGAIIPSNTIDHEIPLHARTCNTIKYKGMSSKNIQYCVKASNTIRNTMKYL